ncbi:MAG: hypothetical protein ACKOCM_08380 [Cyanobacteriota bacterium]
MSDPSQPSATPPEREPERASGRYRFQAGEPADPDEGVHPEMVDIDQGAMTKAGTPNSPEALFTMQASRTVRPEKPEFQLSPKVKQVLDLLESLETDPAEDHQLALFLVRQLEGYHDGVVAELQDDEEARHSQIVAWAVDADRLMRCRMLLESVDLE